MGGETRIHIVVTAILVILLTVVVVFWSYPRLIIYGVLGLAVALAYGALYLIIAAWIDPKSPSALPQSGGSNHATTVLPTDSQVTVVQPEVDADAVTRTEMAMEDLPTEAAQPHRHAGHGTDSGSSS